MLKSLLSVLAVVVLVGCATPATQQAMAISIQDLPGKKNPNLTSQVVVNNVTGGKETNPMWTSQVDAQSFKGALDKSIAMAGYTAADASKAKYSIDANLQDLKQPVFGLTFDVVSTVLYTVTADGKQSQFPVIATGTATTSDAFIGIERLRLANERSIRENIKTFLNRLSEQLGF